VRTALFPAWPVSDQREERLLLEVLHSGKWSVFSGDKVRTFQERFARYQGARHALCVPNGTLAQELALLSLDLAPGDEVIVPAYTFIATVSAAPGVTPRLRQHPPRNPPPDPALIPAAIPAKTRAILPVHLGGKARRR
jgi:3-amino-5-hydroxybenzoate synthase